MVIPQNQKRMITTRETPETIAPFGWFVRALFRPRAIAALIKNQSSRLNPVNGSWRIYNTTKLPTAAAMARHARILIYRFLKKSGETKKYMSAVMITTLRNIRFIPVPHSRVSGTSARPEISNSILVRW
jgi:hypothetical protein